ncbi:MAG: hypothetical protein ABJR46_15820 [Tateyamaria sp.]|uniref:hypothetical protein n=2 Tax=Tateyamaria sp. TaxID=1929288 RepID=UPI00329ADDF9
MDMDQIERAQVLERKFKQREARSQRSKWLGRMIFSLTGMGLLLFLRLNPEVIIQAMSTAQSFKGEQDTASLSNASGTFVRKMPDSFVPVRRGGNLPGNGTSAPQQQTQSQADAVSNQLRELSPTR